MSPPSDQYLLACKGFALSVCAVHGVAGAHDVTAFPGKVARERAYGRILQQGDDRQIGAQFVHELRVHPDAEQRITAEFEEMVVEADAVDA